MPSWPRPGCCGPTAPPADLAAALYAYNPSGRYVRAVGAYASQLRANRRAFPGYYHWQVFYGDTLLPEGYPTRSATPAPD